MKRIVATALALLVAAGTFRPIPIQAQDLQVYKDQVVRYLNRSPKRKYYTERNYAPLRDGLKVGYVSVGSGNYQDAFYQLEAGYLYAFVGACDEDCSDVDFTLYGPNGSVIIENLESDDEPDFYVLPKVSGSYRVRAKIPGCSAPVGCYWGVQAYFK